MLLEVRDRDIVLVYEKQVVETGINQRPLCFWKGIVEYKFVFCRRWRYRYPDEIERTVLQHKLLAPYVMYRNC